MRNNTNHQKLRIKKNAKKIIYFFFMGLPLKGYVASEVVFRLGARNEKQYCGNIQ